jgi:transcriptional regulator with XRE-family HTH domain
MKTIGDRIRVARLKAGLETQLSLAKEIGVSKSAVNQWENRPDSVNIRPANLAAIAEACRIDITWLCTGKGDMEGLSREDREWLEIGRMAGSRERQAIREILNAVRERGTNSEPATGTH